MNDFEDIRLKESDDLDDNDKKILADNWDQLTDEEHEAFKDVVEVKKEEPEEKKEKEEEEDKGIVFKTQAELDAAVEKVIEAREKARVEEEERKKREVEGREERFFPEGYKAKDWEDAAKELFPKFKDRIVRDLADASAKQRQKLEEIEKGFDVEIETLKKSGEEIPDVGTDERDKFDADLAEIGLKYKGVSNMTEAYDIYKALQGKGGGPSERQKEIAGKVGKGGSEKKSTEVPSYNRLRKSMDELLEEAGEELPR